MRRAAIATVAAAAVLGVAAPAQAGTYDVTACGSAGVNRSWVADNQFPASFALQTACPLQALSHSPDNAPASFFQYAGWRFRPPAGTVVDRLRIVRYGYRFLDRNDNNHQGGWVAEGRTEDGQISAGFFVESCQIAGDAYLCDFGTNTAAGAPADWDIDGTDVVYQVVCVRFGTCDTAANNFPLAGVTIFSAVATVRDDTAPTLTATGGLLADGWHRPSDAIAVSASDASGISSATAAAGGATGSLPTPCDYARPAPCGSVSGNLTLSGLADGTQPLTLTVKDAAQNPTAITRTVNVDGTAPSAILQPAHGRTIAVKVADELSGVASGAISVRGSSAEPYRALPTTLAKGRLTARLDHGRIARADVRVTVTDGAGNSASGVPARFTAPSRKTARYGHRVTLRGRLTLSAGQPLRGVPVQATATIRRRGATAVPAGATSTDAKGRFRLTLPAGPSRTVRLIFPGAGDALRSVRGVSVRVPASSTIHASRHIVRGRQRVTFSGTIRRAGQPLPAHGLLVILQGRSLGRWRTFADTRTSASGRWRASYRFQGRPGRYPVRVRIRRQSGFPFELGYSRSATVTVE